MGTANLMLGVMNHDMDQHPIQAGGGGGGGRSGSRNTPSRFMLRKP